MRVSATVRSVLRDMNWLSGCYEQRLGLLWKYILLQQDLDTIESQSTNSHNAQVFFCFFGIRRAGVDDTGAADEEDEEDELLEAA